MDGNRGMGGGLQDVKDYLTRDLVWELRTTGRFLRHHLGVVAIVLVLAVALVAWLRPLPPRKAYLATGQQGSTYRAVAERMRAIFQRHGLELVLVETPGLEQGFAQLRDDSDPVDASFMTAGSRKPRDYQHLVSLGSIHNAPVWVFHRQAPAGNNPFATLSQQRIAVGLPGSTTLNVFTELLRANGRGLEQAPLAEQLPDQEALEKFRQGQLDAVFLVDGVGSATVRHLLAVPGVRVLDFGPNAAYIQKIPHLKTVTLPQASVDLQRFYPPQDVPLLSSTISLLVEEKMHPAHQWAFLLAVKELSEEQGSFFSRPGEFPAYIDKSVPLSPAAKLYFEKGVPASFQYLPLWLASLYERLWLLALALLAPLVPLAVVWNKVHQQAQERLLDGIFERMYAFERQLDGLSGLDGAADAAVCTQEFQALRAAIHPLLAMDPRRFETLRKRWDDLRGRFLKRFPAQETAG